MPDNTNPETTETVEEAPNFGVVTDKWNYVYAAYGISWAVLVIYAFSLVKRSATNTSSTQQGK